MKARVQHPQVKPRRDREGWPWVFRYWLDEIQADGSVRTLRKYQAIGPSKGDGAISKKEAEIERDRFLARLNAPTTEVAVEQVVAAGAAPLGTVAQMYIEGYLAREKQISKPTRDKETHYLNSYIIPMWGKTRLNQIQPRAVEDWLHTTFEAWWTMHGVRAIMVRLYSYAEGHGLWEDGKRSPVSRVKLGRKRHKFERRILSFDETAQVLEKLGEPHRLIIEICIATGARISEVLALTWKHIDLDAATIKIEQRVWQQDIGQPKTEGSRRILGLGDVSTQLRKRAIEQKAGPTSWVFPQARDRTRPMWDSAVRTALHQAAQAVGCDFSGFGPHSFRRANITWRQQVGGSAIEASKIAGHSDLEITGQYTFVAPERQNELTRRIQQRIAEAKENRKAPASEPMTPPETAQGLAELPPASSQLQ